METTYSLVTKPWLKVVYKNGKTKEISLNELFETLPEIKKLDGEIQTQNVIMMRLILAIMTTVYTRVNEKGSSYDYLTEDPDFLDVDDAKDELLKTYKNLKQTHDFSAVINYLKKHEDEFDFLSKSKPFYQVTLSQYNNLAQDNNKLTPTKLAKALKDGKGNGMVPNSQINRTINQSNNSLNTYAPVSSVFKNEMSFTELIRWIITYQNMAGTTDKSKVKSENKYSTAKGYLYSLDPVYVNGRDLLDTLMLNLVLFDDSENLPMPKPVWEQDINDYVEKRVNNLVPDNIPELYTLYSRLIYIDYSTTKPVVFVLGLPKPETTNLFTEPMTTWTFNKKDNNYVPAKKSLNTRSIHMWRNFGNYINQNSSTLNQKLPGVIEWIHKLQEQDVLPMDYKLIIAYTRMLSDDNASSQTPTMEINDYMEINTSVVFGQNGLKWQTEIENAIIKTQNVGKKIWAFGKNLENLYHMQNGALAMRMSDNYYYNLNDAFTKWLQNLTVDTDMIKAINTWNKHCLTVANNVIDQQMVYTNLKAYNQDDSGNNVFDYLRMAKMGIRKELK